MIGVARAIQATIGPEFDRVAKAFRDVADRQQGQDRADTLAILDILEEKRIAGAGQRARWIFCSRLAGNARSMRADAGQGRAISGDPGGAAGEEREDDFMPFEQRVPHPLTEQAIRCYAPALGGVYGCPTLRSGSISGRRMIFKLELLQHLRGAGRYEGEADGVCI